MSTIANDLKAGNIIKHKNNLFKVVGTEHVKPGKGGAFIQAELKSIVGNTKLNERFRSDESVERVNFEEVKGQFLYLSGSSMEIMNLETYEQLSIDLNLLNGDS